MLEVLEPGLLTTVQDLGRPGWGHVGVPEGGAADGWSLRIANVLAGNDPGAAALEITLAGPRLLTREPVVAALAGADLGARIRGPGSSQAERQVEPGRSFPLAPGDELAFPGPAQGGSGARAYLAVAGGLDVPLVLGSRATCLAGGFGGLGGRPLRSGDRLLAGARDAAARPSHAWPGAPIAPGVRDPDGTLVVRTLPGRGATPGTAIQGRYVVAPASDRMGVRLERADGGASVRSTIPITSHGVVLGTVQVPPDGRPIVLLADHQTTGGYPVVAVVVAADHAALGQLGPGDAVRFEPVDLAAARAAFADRRASWAAALEVLRADAGWDDLWRSAGG